MLELHSLVVALLMRLILNHQQPSLFHISPHITHNSTNGKHSFLFYQYFILTYISHYYPLTFQHVSSRSGHHEFSFDHSSFLFISLRSRHILSRGKKQILPLIWLNFLHFIILVESANRGDRLTSPHFFICIWSFRTPNEVVLDSLEI